MASWRQAGRREAGLTTLNTNMSRPSVASGLRDVKGKGRATETTPLLRPEDDTLIIGGSSARHHAVSPPPPSPSPRRRRADLRNILVRVFFGALTLSVVAAVFVALLIWSYAQRAEGAGTDKALRAVTWHGPQDIQVLGVGEEGKGGGEGTISLRISGKVGVDADIMMGWEEEDDDMSVWEGIWRDIGRWGITILKEVTVSFGEATVYPHQLGSGFLFKIKARPVIIPITADPPNHGDWLTPLSFDVTLQLSTDAELLERFVTASWETGAINVRVEVDRVHVQGGKTGWRRLVQGSRRNLESYIHMRSKSCPFQLFSSNLYQVPSIPGIPEPRPPIAKLINLVSYSLIPTADHNLTIIALATVPNPLPECHTVTPSLPYQVSLLAPSLSPVPIATGRVKPEVTPSNITLPIKGTILRVPSTSTSPHATIILSHFLTLYLSGISPPIRISTPLLPHLHLDTIFPAPNPPPKVLRDVTIKRMMLSMGKEGEFFASGTVWARLVMPKGINVPINATDIWPDVLVFDGEVPKEDEPHSDRTEDVVRPAGIHLPHLPLPTWLPTLPPYHKAPKPQPPQPPVPPVNLPSHGGGDSDDDDDGEKEPPPLPDPIPERAFARIRPRTWLPACTTPDAPPDDREEDGWVIIGVDGGDEETGWSATVTSRVHEVPLEVLPGRDAQFRSFVSKVLLSKSGALAGVKGTSAVRVAVPGLLAGKDDEDDEEVSRLELRGLPFEGVVRIGKKGIGL